MVHRIRPTRLSGFFCSWNCVKYYTCFGYGERKPPRGMVSFTALLARRTTSVAEPLRHLEIPLPLPRHALHAFGGPVSIEKFREGFLTIESPGRLLEALQKTGMNDVMVIMKQQQTKPKRVKESSSLQVPVPPPVVAPPRVFRSSHPPPLTHLYDD